MSVRNNRGKIFRLLIVNWTLGVLLSGCIPVRSIYYEPQAGLGKIISEGSCSMSIERELSLSLSEDMDLDLQIQLDHSKEEPTRLYVRYSISSGHIIRFMDDSIDVQVGADMEPYSYKLTRLKVAAEAGEPYQTISVTDAIESKEWVTRDGTDGRTYFFFSLPLQIRPEQLSVLLPALMEDGKLITIPKVMFTKKKRVHVTGLCQ